MLSLIAILGAGVAILLVIWLTARLLTGQQAVPVLIQDVGGGFEDGVIGESMQLDSPNPQELPSESELLEPELKDQLAAISDAVALRQAQLDDPLLSEDTSQGGGGQSTGTGNRVGRGRGSGEPGIPREERWDIRFQEGATLKSYAAQLDFFRIELGVIGGGSRTYVSNLAADQPTVRTAGIGEPEQRLHFSWRRGSQRAAADRDLLAKAGVDSEGKILVQFIPRELEAVLVQLELQHEGRTQSEIRKTRFGVKPQAGGYAFYVIDQQAF